MDPETLDGRFPGCGFSGAGCLHGTQMFGFEPRRRGVGQIVRHVPHLIDFPIHQERYAVDFISHGKNLCVSVAADLMPTSFPPRILILKYYIAINMP
jgi:hypothetical protein